MTTAKAVLDVPRRQVVVATTVVLAAIPYFVLAVAVLHLLRTDLDPLRHPTSQYAVGPYS